MVRRRIGIAGCQDREDPDWPLLRDAITERGCDPRRAAWDDPSVEWSSFDRVVIRSTWNYVGRHEEYLQWARRVARVTDLQNRLDVLAWNIDKHYLDDLRAEGLPAIATTWLAPGDGEAGQWEPPQGDFVVKPSVSAGGVDTARYGPGEHQDARAHVARLRAKGQTVMVQPYVHAVDDEGEMAMVFFAGRFSHAVRKAALLPKGEGVVDRLWERTEFSPAGPTGEQLAVAQHVVDRAQRRFDVNVLYCRVDLVTGPAGTPLVLEVELIEPFLFLQLAPGSGERFARIILGV